MRAILALLIFTTAVDAAQPVLVISVDGLDHRYLRDADKLGLKIPNLRRLMREGEFADGVTGVLPTVTWPSHTSMITGVRPSVHGILGNRRPASEGGAYYWSANLLKVKTLWHATRAAGLKSASITWPVTEDAEIDYNLPESFSKRNGGFMDLEAISKKATPGLIAEISAAYPSFPQEWMNDRTRTLATVFLIKQKKPDLILLHLVDHDSEAHEKGPFSTESKAVLEYTDELIGDMVKAAAGSKYIVALVSDHGFERTDRIVNLPALLKQKGLQANIEAIGGATVAALDAPSAAVLNGMRDVLIPIEKEEVLRYWPEFNKHALFQPVEHAMFGNDPKPKEIGNHGLWPGRSDYRSVFILWGPQVRAAKKPEMSMLEIAPRLASIIGIKLPAH